MNILVVEAIAEAEGVSAEDLQILHEVVDTDALDNLFADTPTDVRRPGSVIFRHGGYEVTVTGDDHVAVTPLSVTE